MVDSRKSKELFRFKQFEIAQDRCPMKIGTDGILLGAWAEVTGAKRILDIGTGTGLIAIMLGQRSASAQIHAVEIDATSYGQAQENMAPAPWSDRMHLHGKSIQDFARSTDLQFDLVVSNPPFFTGGTFSDRTDRTQARHTVKMPHGELLTAVRTLLAPDGKFAVVLPLIEGLRFQEMAETYHLYCTRTTEVYPKTGKPVRRLLMQFEQEEKPMRLDQLVIQREQNNDWTDDFVALTKDFYLDM